MPKAGDIILTPFPFTDLSGNKVRPALVLGAKKGSNDITVCFISSMPQNKLYEFDILIDPKEVGFEKMGLKLKSVIKTVKIATLDKAIVIGKIGELNNKNIHKVKNVLKIYFGL